MWAEATARTEGRRTRLTLSLRGSTVQVTLSGRATDRDWLEMECPLRADAPAIQDAIQADDGVWLYPCPGVVGWLERVNALSAFKAMPGLSAFAGASGP